MLAINYYGKKQLKLEELPVNRLSSDEVVIKVERVLLSKILTNEYFYGPILSKFPRDKNSLVLGTSYGGKIVEVGEDVNPELLNKKVAVLPLVYCGECEYCKFGNINLCKKMEYYGLIKKDGGLAEYSIVKKDNIFLLNDKTENLMTFIEPLLIALKTTEVVEKKYGENYDKPLNILILGTGNIGLATALVWRILRKNDNIFANDLFISRTQFLEDGIFDKYDINCIQKGEIKSEGYDIVIDCAGFEALSLEPALYEGLRYLKKGGCLITTGTYFQNLELPILDIIKQEKSIYATLFYNKKSLEKLSIILKDLKVDLNSITSTLNLNEVIKKGIFKAQIDKDEFIRLEIKC